jgi:hypothetical protein
MRSMMRFGFTKQSEVLEGCEDDRKSIKELGVVLPSEGFATRHVTLMRQYKAGSGEAKKQLAEHIDTHWVTNWTLIDFDFVEGHIQRDDVFYDRPAAISRPDEDKVPSIETDPVEIAEMLLPVTKGGVLQRVGDFFGLVALSVLRLSPRLEIEALVGEMTDTMDRLRWNCLDARSQPLGGIDPSKFPRTYDRIHMSNIP